MRVKINLKDLGFSSSSGAADSMGVYLDISALVKLYAEESGSQRVGGGKRVGCTV